MANYYEGKTVCRPPTYVTIQKPQAREGVQNSYTSKRVLKIKHILKENEIMLEKLKELIADQLNADADSITAETRFKEDLEADSLDLFELIMSLEEEFGVEIPSEDLEKIVTVGDVISYINDKAN